MMFPSSRMVGGAALALLLAAGGCQREPGSPAPEPAQAPADSASLEDSASLQDSAMRPLDPPAGPGSLAPNLARGRDGALLTWLEPQVDASGETSGHGLFLAELTEGRWSAPRQIASGHAFFANWADLPAVVETRNGTRFAHWLSKLGDDIYAYGAFGARSRDDGAWEEMGLLHDDDSPTEHGFVSYVALPEGGAQAFWLDGRRMPEGGGMELRTTVLTAQGPGASTLLDDRVCECCATDAALAAGGPVVVYRDRSATEIRDISLIRATAGGWSEPVAVHADGWKIQGCPVNGPAVAARGSSVAVAWFSGEEPRPKVSVAFSGDGGASFSEPFPVDEDRPLGRVDIALDDRGGAIVSWLGSAGEEAEVRWRRIAADGTGGPPRVAATTSGLRSSGFPRLLRQPEGYLLAWIEGSDPAKLRAGLLSPPPPAPASP